MLKIILVDCGAQQGAIVGEHRLAMDGNFEEEIRDLQRLGVPAEPALKQPESIALTLVLLAMMWAAFGGAMILNVILKILFDAGFWLFGPRILPFWIFVLFPLANHLLSPRWVDVPEPGVLRGLSGTVLRFWRSLFWFTELSLWSIVLAWVIKDRPIWMAALPERYEALEQPIFIGVFILILAISLLPIILLQIAIEARHRSER